MRTPWGGPRVKVDLLATPKSKLPGVRIIDPITLRRFFFSAPGQPPGTDARRFYRAASSSSLRLVFRFYLGQLADGTVGENHRYYVESAFRRLIDV